MIYSLSDSGYEHHTDRLLEKDVTPEEFEADCREAIKAVGMEHIKEHDGWIGTDYWLNQAAEWLCKNGYKCIQPSTFWIGDVSIIEGDQDEGQWRELVGDELYQAAILKNAETREDIDDGIGYSFNVETHVYHKFNCAITIKEHALSGAVVTETAEREERYTPCPVCLPNGTREPQEVTA